jgi:hypothetical protein
MSNEALNRIVNTTFRTIDQASAPLRGIAEVAMHTRSVVMGALGTAVLGYTAQSAMSSLSAISSRYEDTVNTIAGGLAALGVSSDFNAGLTDAAAVMDNITIAAARLPGEAEDYISVFQAGLPQLRAAVHGTTDDMLAFSNMYTAISSTFAVSSLQAGHDLTRLLNIQRGTVDRETQTWVRLLPYITAATHGTITAAEQFNRLTLDRRRQILQDTFDSLKPMVDNASSSFSSMMGGFESNMRMLSRMAGEQLFQQVKDELGVVNALLIDSNGHLTPFSQKVVAIGRVLSTVVVNSFRFSLKAIEGLSGSADAFLTRNTTALGVHVTTFNTIASNVGTIFSNLGGVVSPVLTVLNDFGLMVVSVAMPAAAGLSVGLISLSTGLTNAVNYLGPEVSRLIEQMWPFVTTLGQMVGALLPIFGDLLGSALMNTADLLGQFASALGGVLGEMRGWLAERGITMESVSNAGRWLGRNVNAPVVAGIGAGWVELNQEVASLGHNLLNGVSNVLNGRDAAHGAMQSEGLDVLYRRYRQQLGWGEENAPKNLGAASTGPTLGERFTAEMARLQQALRAGQTRPPTTPPTTPRAAGTHNDFRNSRFNITQQFAEGFDPDRIAVAFTRDLERQATQRLSSGLDPLFTVGG